MKIFLASALLFLCATTQAATLSLVVDNAPAEGTLVVQVYDSPNAFGDFRDPAREFVVDLAAGPEHRFDDVPSGEIGLVVGQPAQFRFFSSPVRKHDRPGDVLSTWKSEELEETAPLEAELPADASIDEPYVPVRFQSRITELGMLELWCASTKTEGRWKLEFSVREETEG